MPNPTWLSCSLDQIRDALHARGDLPAGSRITVDRSVFTAMVADIRGFGHRDDLETWAALAGAIIRHQPFEAPPDDRFWVNYVAAHRTAAMWSHPRDGRCGECREKRKCAANDCCLLRYFKKIKMRDLRTQKALIVKERPLRGQPIVMLQILFFAVSLDYLDKGRNYRKRPILHRSWLKRLFS